MGRLRGREISIGFFFLKYFIYIFVGIIVTALFLIGVFAGMASGNFVYLANYAEDQAHAAVEVIQTADQVSEELIPELCRYAVFDKDGRVLRGSMKEKDAVRAWNVMTGKEYNGGFYIGADYYLTIPRGEEYCVLQYQLIVQYRSALLRKYLPLPEVLLFLLFIVLVFGIILSVAVRFHRVIRRKLSPLAEAADMIQRQELDFAIVHGSVKEINTVLNAMDDMRIALKESLENQWRTEQMKNEQISALAHDLKTPLTLVRGNAELLGDTPLTKEQREYTGCIIDSALQMQDYVQMMIDITRTSAAVSINRRKIDVGEFLAKIKKQVSGFCSVCHIDLQWKCTVFTKEIYAEETLLLRAFMNVFANAVEHTPADGTILFEASEDETYFIFTVANTGKGFTQSALLHATEQFYMDDDSRTAAGSHYGMGLYIVDTIVKQHDGLLMLENVQGMVSDAAVSTETMQQEIAESAQNMPPVDKENGKWVEAEGARVTIKIPVGI